MNSERRILVVEDDSLLREQLCLALSGQYAVAEAGDPDSALVQASQAPTDLVLLDLQLRPNGKRMTASRFCVNCAAVWLTRL
jgi:DNA-binding response OmpR family regulator